MWVKLAQLFSCFVYDCVTYAELKLKCPQEVATRNYNQLAIWLRLKAK